MNNEKEKFENMQSKMESKIRELMSTLEAKGLDHVRLTAELENRYEHKLADQLDRYDKLGEQDQIILSYHTFLMVCIFYLNRGGDGVAQAAL